MPVDVKNCLLTRPASLMWVVRGYRGCGVSGVVVGKGVVGRRLHGEQTVAG